MLFCSIPRSNPVYFSYLKYLTKKFLKKKNVRDFLHVIASNASTYELRFFNVDNADEEADDWTEDDMK